MCGNTIYPVKRDCEVPIGCSKQVCAAVCVLIGRHPLIGGCDPSLAAHRGTHGAHRGAHPAHGAHGARHRAARPPDTPDGRGSRARRSAAGRGSDGGRPGAARRIHAAAA